MVSLGVRVSKGRKRCGSKGRKREGGSVGGVEEVVE